MFDALSGPLWMAVYASGKIKKYQIYISGLLVSTILFSYIFAKYGLNPYWVLSVKPIIGCSILIYRIFFCCKYLDLNLKSYFKEIVVRCFIISVLGFSFSVLIYGLVSSDSLYMLSISIGLILMLLLLIVYCFGLTREEKTFIKSKIKYFDK